MISVQGIANAPNPSSTDLKLETSPGRINVCAGGHVDRAGKLNCPLSFLGLHCE